MTAPSRSSNAVAVVESGGFGGCRADMTPEVIA